jgi:hypothetical protein
MMFLQLGEIVIELDAIAAIRPLGPEEGEEWKGDERCQVMLVSGQALDVGQSVADTVKDIRQLLRQLPDEPPRLVELESTSKPTRVWVASDAVRLVRDAAPEQRYGRPDRKQVRVLIDDGDPLFVVGTAEEVIAKLGLD